MEKIVIPKILPFSKKLSVSMWKTLGPLINSKDSLNLEWAEFSRASVSGTSKFTLGGDRIKISDKTYDLTPEKN